LILPEGFRRLLVNGVSQETAGEIVAKRPFAWHEDRGIPRLTGKASDVRHFIREDRRLSRAYLVPKL